MIEEGVPIQIKKYFDPNTPTKVKTIPDNNANMTEELTDLVILV